MNCIKFVDFCVENGTKAGFEKSKEHFMKAHHAQSGLSQFK